MFRNWTFLLSLLPLLVSAPIASADDTNTEKLNQLSNTTETVLRTIFLGDIRRTKLYLDELANAYASFLDGFLHDYYCSPETQGPEAVQSCLDVKKSEEEQLKKGLWTKGYQLHEAEFSNGIDGTNIGTYNFVKSVKHIGPYDCHFGLQITAVFFYPFTITREFSFDCKRAK